MILLILYNFKIKIYQFFSIDSRFQKDINIKYLKYIVALNS